MNFSSLLLIVILGNIAYFGAMYIDMPYTYDAVDQLKLAVKNDTLILLVKLKRWMDYLEYEYSSHHNCRSHHTCFYSSD